MDERKKQGTQRWAVVALVVLFAGCATKPAPAVRTKSQTEVAVSELPADWLQGCDKIEAGGSRNEVGELLLDYTALAEAYAASCNRYKTLSDYLKEVVKKERATPANQ